MLFFFLATDFFLTTASLFPSPAIFFFNLEMDSPNCDGAPYQTDDEAIEATLDL